MKRIKDLQHIFDSPDTYGKGLDWTGYTVHDAANVLRRYLNQLPEPIIPLEFYTRFRDPLTVPPDTFNVDEAIKVYQKLILELPSLNRQLLLYILDLLAVFASRSEQNLMNATNLAAIFQPGLISHPSHDMAPSAYKLSQDVLVFLINHQDHFLLGMQDINDASGAEPPTPMTPTNLKHSKTITRSSYNASAAVDDVKKFGIRRHVSVSSKKSASSPVGKTGGVSRSNTLPSRRSPRAHPSIPRFGHHEKDPTKRSAPALVQSTPRRSEDTPMEPRERPMSVEMPKSQNFEGRLNDQPTRIQLNSPTLEKAFEPLPSTVTTPNRERNFANFFSLSPNDSDRPTRKLRKKRLPGSSNHSAESSTTSLPPVASSSAALNATSLEAVPGSPTSNDKGSRPVPIPASNPATSSGTIATSASTLMPAMSPTPSATSSVTSQESAASFSDSAHRSASPESKTRSRWRWEMPSSPTNFATNGSIAERIRQVSRSPPANNPYASEGSADESRGGSKSPLGWLKRNRRDKDRDGRSRAMSADLTQSAPAMIQETPSPIQEEAPSVLQEAPPVRQEAPPALQEAPPVLQGAPMIFQQPPSLQVQQPTPVPTPVATPGIMPVSPAPHTSHTNRVSNTRPSLRMVEN